MEQPQLTELIERLKKDFNGSTDYHSGVNDGMYHLMHNILLRPTPSANSVDEAAKEYGEWQLCPKCNGDGHLARYNSPNISNGTDLECDVCNGKKILVKPFLAGASFPSANQGEGAVEFAEWMCKNGYDSIQIATEQPMWSNGYNKPEYTSKQLFQLFLNQQK